MGITIATHGWIVSEMSRGKFMVDEGAEMQWKEEREVLAVAFFDISLLDLQCIDDFIANRTDFHTRYM